MLAGFGVELMAEVWIFKCRLVNVVSWDGLFMGCGSGEDDAV